MLKPWFIVAVGGLAWAALAVALWLTLASVAFLWMAGLLHSPAIPSWARPWQWWVYARWFGRSHSEAALLIASAGLATAPFAVWLRLLSLRPGGLRWPILARSPGIVRGTSDNHGHADWMPVVRMQELFPSIPSDDVGGSEGPSLRKRTVRNENTGEILPISSEKS